MFVRTWGLCIFFGVIGLFFLVVTYGALIVSRKSEHNVSGVPCVGGIFIIIAFLFSPYKWLALLGLLDYGFWELPYLLIKDFIIDRNSKPNESDGEEKNR